MGSKTELFTHGTQTHEESVLREEACAKSIIITTD